MLKKISAGIVLVIVLGVSMVGTVFADDSVPPSDGVCPFGGTCDGYGMGGFGYRGSLPGIVAEALEMTVDELYAALAEGQTIAELAADPDHGVNMDDLVATLIAPRVEQLEQAVADDYLTQDQADSMIAQMTEHQAWRLENLGMGYGGSGRGGCGMMGGGSNGRQGGMWGGHSSGMRGGRWGGSTGTPRFPWAPGPSADS